MKKIHFLYQRNLCPLNYKTSKRYEAFPDPAVNIVKIIQIMKLYIHKSNYTQILPTTAVTFSALSVSS